MRDYPDVNGFQTCFSEPGPEGDKKRRMRPLHAKAIIIRTADGPKKGFLVHKGTILRGLAKYRGLTEIEGETMATQEDVQQKLAWIQQEEILQDYMTFLDDL